MDGGYTQGRVLEKDEKTELDNFYLLRVSGGGGGGVRQGLNGSFVIKRLAYFLGA